MKICAACSTTPKNWEGGDRVCGFADNIPFSADNWMCATVQKVREIFWDEGPGPHSQHRHTIFTCFNDDQWTTTIDLDAVELPSGAARTLWVSWYKSRGRTEAMWLLDEYETPRRPTEADIIAIVAGLG